MLSAFKDHIETDLGFLRNSRLLIAISGGIDSVVLTHLCHHLGLNFALAHCNFHLRGEESNADEEFVIDLADQINREVFIQNFDTEDYAKKNKRSIQMAARELRYDWFQDLAENLQFDYILTAHQADDNLETFLINFTRGTGLNGLTGIPQIKDNIIRPLLPFSRMDVVAYANSNAIIWSEDSSNASRKYLRNKLRHEVVPILKEINPQLLDSFKNTLANLNDTADIVDESLNAVAKRAITSIDENGISYKISEFKKVNNPRAYLFEMFKAFGFQEWNDVLSLLDAQTGKQVFSETHRLIKHRDFLILSERQTAEFDTISISEKDSLVKTPFGTIEVSLVSEIGEASPFEIYVDADRLEFPLELRIWSHGDSFQPLGMQGKKKISKYLKDEKLSLVEKENTWLLCSGETIIWLLGLRADERFKVTTETDKILKLKIES